MPNYARNGEQKKKNVGISKLLIDDRTSGLPFVRHPVAFSALRPRCLCYIILCIDIIVYIGKYMYIIISKTRKHSTLVFG